MGVGRNQKNNADYFPHDADASNDEKIVYLESKFGLKGYAIYFKLLEYMTRADGFKLQWNDIKKNVYASKFGISVTEIELFVTECCRNEIKAFVLEDELLYSPGLLKRFDPLIQKREYNRRKYREQKQTLTSGDKKKAISVAEMTQSKVKKSKVEKRKKESIKEKKIFPSQKRFSPPTVEEVKAYCDERDNGVDPELFVNFYEGKGWMIGKNKMKNWQAAVRTWERKHNGIKRNGGKSRNIFLEPIIEDDESTGTGNAG